MIAQSIVLALLLAGLLASVSVGLTLQAGVTRIFNFAHGEIVMLGAYTVYYLNPVFRYDGKDIPKYSATVDVMKTWIWRVAFVLAIVAFVFIRNRIKR